MPNKRNRGKAGLAPRQRSAVPGIPTGLMPGQEVAFRANRSPAASAVPAAPAAQALLAQARPQPSAAGRPVVPKINADSHSNRRGSQSARPAGSGRPVAGRPAPSGGRRPSHGILPGEPGRVPIADRPAPASPRPRPAVSPAPHTASPRPRPAANPAPHTGSPRPRPAVNPAPHTGNRGSGRTFGQPINANQSLRSATDRQPPPTGRADVGTDREIGRGPARDSNGSTGRAGDRGSIRQPLLAVRSDVPAQTPVPMPVIPCPGTPLRVIPLGGMREIGKNMTVYEYDDDMIIIDCGLAFPEDDMPGIDVVIPDFSYVIQNRHKLRGIFLTHGHEDHIGALPWLCREVSVPIYGNSLTIALTRLKLEDRIIGAGHGAELVEVKPGERVRAGCFDVEFIHINHSIADANSFAVRTPAGTIFHSGDFKIDYTPVNGVAMDLSRIAAVGSEGVLLLMCESTNVERRGYTPSESKVAASFAAIFARATGRIIVATFSSNVFRLQSIISAAENQNRKVALIGRSMINVFNAANELGYIHMQPDTLIDVGEIDRFADSEIVLISTGSQGEPMSALTRMAFAEHRNVDIKANDTVVISASPIPGNEKPIYRVINELFKRGANVIYESLADIHVSGHAYQEELKLLHSLVKPKFFLPGHGEYRHLYRHGELANALGLSWDNITLLNNGDIYEICGDGAEVVGFINAAGVLIDGSGQGDIDNLVLRDRRLLAEDGVVTIFVAISGDSGAIVAQPDIQARGFIYETEAEQVVEECQRKISAFARKAERDSKPLAGLIRSGALRDQLRDLLYERTKRRPIILVSLLEV